MEQNETERTHLFEHLDLIRLDVLVADEVFSGTPEEELGTADGRVESGDKALHEPGEGDCDPLGAVADHKRDPLVELSRKGLSI